MLSLTGLRRRRRDDWQRASFKVCGNTRIADSLKRHLNKIIAVCFAVAVLILGFIGVITYRGITDLIHAADMVSHTREVLENVEALFSDLSEAESGQRGYIITGEEGFLEPYDNALAQITDHIKRLRELTFDNPIQQKRLADLKILVDIRL